MLWAPFAVPMALHLDVRLLSLVGMLFVPVACAIAAVVLARAGRRLEAAAWIAVAAAIGASPDLEHFMPFAHTPVYWPLLALFAWLVARERWLAAAVALGLLVVARTTMVAIVPVFWMTVWLRCRPRAGAALALTVMSGVVPFLPFLAWDPSVLAHALYGAYQQRIKGYLWPRTTAVQHSVGFTGLLLTWGLPRAVEWVQLLVVLATQGAAWRTIRLGSSPLPWLALALLAFSTTALWPVSYLYFDEIWRAWSVERDVGGRDYPGGRDGVGDAAEKADGRCRIAW